MSWPLVWQSYQTLGLVAYHVVEAGLALGFSLVIWTGRWHPWNESRRTALFWGKEDPQ
jgi:hypothetical protein